MTETLKTTPFETLERCTCPCKCERLQLKQEMYQCVDGKLLCLSCYKQAYNQMLED